MLIKNITKHNLFFEFYKPNMTDLQTSGTFFENLAWYRRTKDLVPLFDPNVHLFENNILKIMAQLQEQTLEHTE